MTKTQIEARLESMLPAYLHAQAALTALYEEASTLAEILQEDHANGSAEWQESDEGEAVEWLFNRLLDMAPDMEDMPSLDDYSRIFGAMTVEA